ncbi:LPS export ABC transporter periplasmic protein LptC [Kordiimonas sp. SCSIO 12610]|uniref:LPS export ABC transporter periplasmic protein LptC n=1 Tax=Kordiimonas sp. SCSIO 12610 TaxID=2829597 RepID=UPI00210EA46C|nr:LPS export ABC transporter periplasmic protein LptC [Kordiimonas sp. SCSIO 12610]UTW55534.1 LPS export ABC transporter periplasmic protein LptC [Kordiimonas sp. SCSIO 12610]
MAKTVTDHYDSEERAKDDARNALLPKPIIKEGPFWDQFVSLMRITLPVFALILGAITILWPFINEKEVSFTLSKDEVAQGDGRVRMTNLQYVGTDNDNRLFTVTAESGEQADPNAERVKLTAITAKMEVEPDVPAIVNARTGIYRMKERTLSLIGGVHLETGNGYTLDMLGADVDLSTRSAEGQGSILGTSDLGEIRASRMTIQVKEQIGLFEGGVKMRILPQRPDNDRPEPSKPLSTTGS